MEDTELYRRLVGIEPPWTVDRRACRVLGVNRSSYRYRRRRTVDATLRQRLREFAHERVRFGYRRLHGLLRREGRRVNLKRIYRLYREEGLAVRRHNGRASRRVERPTSEPPALQVTNSPGD